MSTKSTIWAVALPALLTLISCQSSAPAAAPAQPTQAASTAAKPAAPAAIAPAPATAVTAPAAAPAAAPTTAPEILKVGILTSQTGPGQRASQSYERFMRMAMDDINGKGGVKVGNKTYRFEAVTADDKSTADGGRDGASRLVLAEKVRFVLGPITTPTSGAQTVTEPAKVLLLAAAAADKSLGTAFPLTFAGGLSHNIMRSNAVYDWLAKDHPQAKRIAIVMTDDTAGRAIADVAEANAKSRGMTVVAREFFPNDIKDFGPLVTRLLRETPDAIDTAAGGRGPLFFDMMKNLNQQGFKGQVFGTSGDLGAMREGASFINNFTAATLADWKAASLTSGEKDALQRFVAKYPEGDLEPFTVAAYNIPLALTQGIEKAATVEDAQKIAQALRENALDTIWLKEWGKVRWVGAKTFGLPAVLEQPVYLSKVGGGQVSTFTAIKGTLP